MDQKRQANKLAQREFRRRKKDYVTNLENFLVAEFGRDILERTPGTSSHQSIIFSRLQDKVRLLKQRYQECPSEDELSVSLLNDIMKDSPTFPDEEFLILPAYKIFDACVRNAARIGVMDIVLDPGAISPCDKLMASSLPDNLKATALQQTKPHHPIIDIIPWPSTRDRLITATSVNMIDLWQFVADMDDGGVSVWGSDPSDDDNWEIQEPFMVKYWFLFDSSQIKRSNWWRKGRGELPLQLKAMSPAATP